MIVINASYDKQPKTGAVNCACKMFVLHSQRPKHMPEISFLQKILYPFSVKKLVQNSSPNTSYPSGFWIKATITADGILCIEGFI